MDALAARALTVLEREGLERLAIGGGVAANSELRARLESECAAGGVRLYSPPLALCTDNAAMIGAAARFVDPVPYPDYLGLDASARVA